MNLQTETIHYQNALEAFRQHPWNDDHTEQLRQATYALEAAYLEHIPTMDDPHTCTDHPTPTQPRWHTWAPYLAIALLIAAAAILARRYSKPGATPCPT
jgi:hypothetical protein